jgi:ATP-dependent Clp protease ATP-binding subunit ClpB
LEKELADVKETSSALNAQWQSEKDVIQDIQKLKQEIEQLNTEIQQAERDYDLNRAAELKYGNLATLQKQLDAAETRLTQTQTSGKSMLREEVAESDIAEIISKWTGIPLSKLVESEMQKLPCNWSRRSGYCCGRCHSAIAGWAGRPQPPHR